MGIEMTFSSFALLIFVAYLMDYLRSERKPRQLMTLILIPIWLLVLYPLTLANYQYFIVNSILAIGIGGSLIFIDHKEPNDDRIDSQR